MLKRIICFLLMIIPLIAFADSPEPTVNILTWWGYLDYPDMIQSAEKACHAKISFDEYYSNDEFLRRWQSQKDSYDIIIFSDTIYNIIKDKIPKFDSDKLWMNSLSYNPIVRKHYYRKKYPHNVVYFLQSLTGFVWNPAVINISEKDSIQDIFKKAGQNDVVIMDDSLEPFKLVESTLGSNLKGYDIDEFNFDNFKKLISKSNVYIANNNIQVYDSKKFAFSFNWSGDSIEILKKSKGKYRFFIHPGLSYISADLLARTSNTESAVCVSRFITSKEYSIDLQDRTYYFSPYNDVIPARDNLFQSIYKTYIRLLRSLGWLDYLNKNDFNQVNKNWQLIKISLNNHLLNNGIEQK